MGNTHRVLDQLGVFKLADEIGFAPMVFDELLAEDWVMIEPTNSHWEQGFPFARPALEAGALVQTCCLKTHRFGGHFTLSLKNSVGIVAKRVPGEVYDYMWELHTSPFQRQMIAEINRHYSVDVVLMDGIRAFVNGGPERGEVVEPNL